MQQADIFRVMYSEAALDSALYCRNRKSEDFFEIIKQNILSNNLHYGVDKGKKE